MSKEIEDALNRASPNRKQAIEYLKSRVSSVENTEPTDLKGRLHENFKEGIESAEKGPDNYLYPNKNAIDKTKARPNKEPQKPAPETEKEH